MTINLVGVMALDKARDKETAGFKAPPETSAKHQTENITDIPNPKAIKMTWPGWDTVVNSVFSFNETSWLATLQMT